MSTDFNSRTVKSQQVAKNTLYADLNLKLKNHPGTKDVVPVVDLDAVKNSIKNLLLTNYVDRPFHPEIGSNVSGLLFEPVDQFTAASLREEIKTCLGRFEPRINQVVVNVVDASDRNSYQITVGFNVISSDIRQGIAFYLERLR